MKGLKMNGIIVINKPKNCTSHDIVAQVKKIVKEKVGHTGTLDPNATGVLPLLLGQATACSKYLISHDKTYKVLLQLGKKTDTLDIEGKILEEKEVDLKELTKQKVEKVFKDLVGKQEQMPPMYSAIKINGKKLYEYARKGEKIEVKPRTIELYSMKLLKIDEIKKQISFIVSCSKGTYIRSLCEEVAERLNTIGYMQELERTQVGIFNLENSVTVGELEQNINNVEWLEKNIITVEKFFRKKDKINLDNRKLQLFLNGVKLTYKFKDDVYRIYCGSQFIGTGTIENELLKRDIVVL